MKAQVIDHFENGRKYYSEEDIIMFLKNYSFSQENFKSLLNFKILNKQLVNHFILKIQKQSTND